MIEIKSAAPDTAAKLCADSGICADTVLEMTERDKRLGFACMTYQNDAVTLVHLQAPDSALTDALLRAALNSARSAGAKTAFIEHEAVCLHMVKKGYLTESGPFCVEIANFFAKSTCNA